MAKLGLAMRLPFPERIPLPITVIAATTLFGLQQFQGTSLAFSIYSLLFIIIANIAFNQAGGFTRPSGSYVFFYAVLAVIFGLVFKAYLGEPGDSNLRSPLLTIQVHTGGISAMLAAVFISRKLSRKKAILGAILKEKDMRNATLGAVVVGTALYFILTIIPHGPGSLLTAVAQINRFLPLAVILGTLHIIRKSGGRKAYDFPVILAFAISMVFGILSFGKEGMFTPFVCWIIAAASLRYRLRTSELIGVVAMVAFGVTFLVPYSQYGRNFIPENVTLGDRVSLATSLIGNLGYVRQQFLADEQNVSDSGSSAGYYNNPEGFADRLTMLPVDDLLIDYTNQGHAEGYLRIAQDFANWIPHFLWPNKPAGGAGNFYARQIGGIIADDDTSTGISFSPSAQAYHMGEWTGVFVVAPLIWIMLFVTFDSLCGDTRTSPWGLLVMAMFSHAASEGMLSGAIYLVWFYTVALIFSAVCTAYILPIVGSLIFGPEKTNLVHVRSPRAAHRKTPVQVLSPDVNG
jgi:hypothetical protein